MAVTLTANEFLTGLSNLALVVRLYPTNTSGEVERFVDSFRTETLSGGNTKIFPFVDMPAVKDYTQTSSVTTVSAPDTAEQVLQTNFRKMIPVSYSTYILKAAFTSESGMNDFVGYVLGMSNSALVKFLYEQIVAEIFGMTLTADRSKQTITIAADPASTTTYAERLAAQEWSQKEIVKAIEIELRNMTGVFSDQYNELGFTQALDYSDLRMILFEPWAAEQTLDVMATLLNSSVIEREFRKPDLFLVPSLAVPASPTTNANIIGVIMHKQRVQHFLQFEARGDFFDASNLVINDFLHAWGAVGEVTGLPACQFVAAKASA